MLKTTISKDEFEAIAGTYIALEFYRAHREEYPVAMDLIQGMIDGVTEEELQKIQDCANEAAQIGVQTAESLSGVWDAIGGGRPLPSDDEQVQVIKQVAFAHGMALFYEASDIQINDLIYKFLSHMGIEVLWNNTRATEEVLSAIYIEGLAIAMLGSQIWPAAKGQPYGQMVAAQINSKFIVVGSKIELTYPH